MMAAIRITGLTAWIVPLTSHVAYHMASGKSCETVETVVIRLKTDAGLEGWGEVCPIPGYLPAYARGVIPALTEMAPVLIGSELTGPEAVMARLDAKLKGHRYAKSAVDIALWDLMGKHAELPLHALLGGRRVPDMPIYHSISCLAPDVMAGIASEAYASGIRQFQVKLGADADWQADVTRLRQVRKAVGSGPLVYGDWNCGSTRLDAIRVGRAVADLDIMLEQPCETIEECAAVRDATGLPLKLDEAAHDPASLLLAYRLGCLEAVAVKLSKFGGVSAARRARDLCLHLGAKMCIEDTWGSDITTAAVLHLGAASPADLVMNVCDLSHYVSPRLCPGAPVRCEGRIAPPEGAGLGVEPDMDVLRAPALEL